MLANYTELQSEVMDMVARSDVSASATMVPRWIYLCEQELNLLLMRREMTQRATTLTVADQEAYALPLDFNTAMSMHVNGTRIDVLAPSDFDKIKLEFQGQTGIPQKWSMTQDEFLLGPVPDVAYTLELYYYKGIQNLSNTNPSHWVLQKYPSVMLYGTLAEAAKDARIGEDSGGKWQAAYDRAVKALIKDQIAERSLGGGPLLSTNLPFGIRQSASIFTDQ